MTTFIKGPMGLNSIVNFGKYKDIRPQAADLMKTDPGYMAWLRKQRGRGDFTPELNAAIDIAITSDFKLARDYRSTLEPNYNPNAMTNVANEKIRKAIVTGKADAERATVEAARQEVAYEGAWGDW